MGAGGFLQVWPGMPLIRRKSRGRVLALATIFASNADTLPSCNSGGDSMTQQIDGLLKELDQLSLAAETLAEDLDLLRERGQLGALDIAGLTIIVRRAAALIAGVRLPTPTAPEGDVKKRGRQRAALFRLDPALDVQHYPRRLKNKQCEN
jgi:hypothetical protein